MDWEKLHRLIYIILFASLNSCTTVLYVGSKKMDCSGVGEQKCYLIRKSPEGNWVLHYEEIKGLEYEPGFSYKVKVKKHKLDNVPADKTSYQYEVVEVLQKIDVTGDIVLADLTGKEWQVEYLKADGVQYAAEDKIPTIIFSEDRKMNGFTGCNNYFGKYELRGRTLYFRELANTRMHCEETRELEQAFLKLLSMELRGIFIEGKLILSGDGGSQMILGYK